MAVPWEIYSVEQLVYDHLRIYVKPCKYSYLLNKIIKILYILCASDNQT
jgi:hypothetical protein